MVLITWVLSGPLGSQWLERYFWHECCHLLIRCTQPCLGAGCRPPLGDFMRWWGPCLTDWGACLQTRRRRSSQRYYSLRKRWRHSYLAAWTCNCRLRSYRWACPDKSRSSKWARKFWYPITIGGLLGPDCLWVDNSVWSSGRWPQLHRPEARRWSHRGVHLPWCPKCSHSCPNLLSRLFGGGPGRILRKIFY